MVDRRLRLPEGTCDGCGAAIGWIRTVNRKPMPVDPEPQIRMVDSGEDHGGIPIMVAMKSYTSHFATCPKADRFRQGKLGAEDATETIDVDDGVAVQEEVPL